ncbi:outer membrane beta-barrel protein [Vibrio coralliilyticus]|uniref:outer membrane beta-barrel protein n=1 Tax=Vibrio coralliilyticus TaxID=190893 RepID=UPI00148E17F8|nr:outer membrane beta-barrel protein [Vibrio coralliilyticus]NOI30358.1 porin family protein [Vibrio coralliilyticus]NOI49946.1 porin family protein [Vibrio coralliilyticus]WFB51266.1 outer membrane beta-barrel protein [Vibrio coralliilyticus]
MNKTTRLVMPLLCLSLPVSAQDWSDGWYVGVDFAQSTVDWQSNYDQVKGVLIDTRLDDEMSGLSLNVGKRMTSWLSLEANYGRVTSDVMSEIRSLGVLGLESYVALYEQDTLSIGAKFIYEAPYQFTFYAKPSLDYTKTRTDFNASQTLGLTSGKIEINESKTATALGLEFGSEWFVTDHYAIHVAYKRQFDGMTAVTLLREEIEFDLDTIKLGLNYYF